MFALTVTATNNTRSMSSAKPLADGATGKSLGFGALVALNFVDNLTEAMVENGATITDGSNVKFAANANHQIDTTAEMSRDGGTAITPVVAPTFATDTCAPQFDTGSTVTVSGNLDGVVNQVVDVKTEGLGDAEGDSGLAAGGVFAYTNLHDVAEARSDGR